MTSNNKCFFLLCICIGVPNITVVVNSDPSVSDIMIGNGFNITCLLSCPTASVTWGRDGVIISNSSSTAVTIDGFSVVYLMDGDGLVERSVLKSSMAVLNDSANYWCISIVQGIETADNITVFVYGTHYIRSYVCFFNYVHTYVYVYMHNVPRFWNSLLYNIAILCP